MNDLADMWARFARDAAMFAEVRRRRRRRQTLSYVALGAVIVLMLALGVL